MNYEIINIEPVVEKELTVRLGFTLKATDPDTNESNTGSSFAEFPEGVTPYFDRERKDLIVASREYATLAAQVAGPLLAAKTIRRAPEFAPPAPAALSDAEIRARWVKQIDTNIGAIIRRRTEFERGYEQREAASRAFKAAGYTGDPTIWIMAFANEAGFTAQQAADIIIGQADALRQGLEDLEALRMRKYRVQRAVTQQEANDAFGAILTEAAAIDKALP